MAVYLIHLDAPLGNEKHQATHYIGYTKSGRTLEGRLNDHRNTRWEELEEPEITPKGRTKSGIKIGSGSVILAAANAKGIAWRCVRVWKGEKANRKFERMLKRQNHSARLCPVCNPDHWKENYPSATHVPHRNSTPPELPNYDTPQYPEGTNDPSIPF